MYISATLGAAGQRCCGTVPLLIARLVAGRFVYQLGTVSPAEQQRQLFSSTEGAAACAGTATDAKPAPATELAGAAQSDPHKQQ